MEIKLSSIKFIVLRIINIFKNNLTLLQRILDWNGIKIIYCILVFMNELREDLIYCSVKNGGWFFSTSWVSISLSVLSPSVLASETWPCWLSPHWLLAQHGCYYGPNTNQVDPRSCFHAVITIEHKNYCTGYQNGPSVLQQHEHPGLRMPKRHPLRTPKH